MRIAITGASGGIGRRLMATLGASHELTGIVRTLRPGDGPQVAFANKDGLARVLGASDCVIHCALDSKAKGRDFLTANRQMNSEILEGALGGACRLYIYVSSQVVYSGTMPADPAGYREDQELILTPKEDDYTRLKIEGEAQVIAACRKAGIDYLIVRPTVVMGPGMAWSEDIVNATRFLPIGIKNRTMNLVLADDVAQYVERLIDGPSRNEAFNLGTTNVTSTAYFNEVGRINGRTTRFLPDWLMNLVGKALPSTMWFFAKDVAIDSDKVKGATGLHFDRPIAGYFSPRPEPGRGLSLATLQARQRSGVPFRAEGQGYRFWFNPLHGESRVAMADYSGIVGLDAETITVKSGTKLSVISEHLDTLDRALPTLPEFSGISAGACFFVDVHGSSGEYFSLYECIEAIKYLDESGEVVVSQKGDPLWDELRRRERGFILLEVTFRTGRAGFLGNFMEWRDDAALAEYFAGKFRDNFSTTLHWYPRYRKVLVYNVNRIEAQTATSAPSLAPFRGLPYAFQHAILGFKLRGRAIQIDRFHRILAPWTTVPMKWLWGWLVSRPALHWRDMEMCLSLADGAALIAALRDMTARGEMKFDWRAGIGIRFSHDSAQNKSYAWVEFVSNDTRLVDTFIATARRVAQDEVRFHRGKYTPAS